MTPQPKLPTIATTLAHIPITSPFRYQLKNIPVKASILALSALILLVASSTTQAQDKFYNYYDNGMEYLQNGDWLRAIEEFRSAVSLEFEDAKRKRTYGTRFIRYLPHLQLGKAHQQLGEYENARRELELSLAYVKTKETKALLEQLEGIGEGETLAIKRAEPKPEPVKEPVIEPVIVEPEPYVPPEKELVKVEVSEKEPEPSPQLVVYTPPPVIAPPVFEPSRVTQVGSRFSIAVMPLQAKGDAVQYGDLLTEELISRLVNLRRFKIIERGALDKILQEQALGMSGVVDEATAVEVGRVAGADAIVVGSVIIAPRFGKVSVRVISIETSETIIAEEADTKNTKIQNLEKITGEVALGIYAALPLVEGTVIEVDELEIYLDIGARNGLRKGTKCIGFSEGKQIVHPVTKEVIGKRNKKLAELVVIEVQERMAVARYVENEKGTVSVGDKVVVK